MACNASAIDYIKVVCFLKIRSSWSPFCSNLFNVTRYSAASSSLRVSNKAQDMVPMMLRSSLICLVRWGNFVFSLSLGGSFVWIAGFVGVLFFLEQCHVEFTNSIVLLKFTSIINKYINLTFLCL